MAEWVQYDGRRVRRCEALARTIVDLAVAGDKWALGACLDRSGEAAGGGHGKVSSVGGLEQSRRVMALGLLAVKKYMEANNQAVQFSPDMEQQMALAELEYSGSPGPRQTPVIDENMAPESEVVI